MSLCYLPEDKVNFLEYRLFKKLCFNSLSISFCQRHALFYFSQINNNNHVESKRKRIKVKIEITQNLQSFKTNI